MRVKYDTTFHELESHFDDDELKPLIGESEIYGSLKSNGTPCFVLWEVDLKFFLVPIYDCEPIVEWEGSPLKESLYPPPRKREMR